MTPTPHGVHSPPPAAAGRRGGRAAHGWASRARGCPASPSTAHGRLAPCRLTALLRAGREGSGGQRGPGLAQEKSQRWPTLKGASSGSRGGVPAPHHGWGGQICPMEQRWHLPSGASPPSWPHHGQAGPLNFSICGVRHPSVQTPLPPPLLSLPVPKYPGRMRGEPASAGSAPSQAGGGNPAFSQTPAGPEIISELASASLAPLSCCSGNITRRCT